MAVEEKFGLLKRLHGPVASLMVLLFVQGEIASVTDFFSQLAAWRASNSHPSQPRRFGDPKPPSHVRETRDIHTMMAFATINPIPSRQPLSPFPVALSNYN
jgi:hypothetical protein